VLRQVRKFKFEFNLNEQPATKSVAKNAGGLQNGQPENEEEKRKNVEISSVRPKLR